jgi:hypothetical protein
VAPQQGTYTYIEVRRTCFYFFSKTHYTRPCKTGLPPDLGVKQAKGF